MKKILESSYKIRLMRQIDNGAIEIKTEKSQDKYSNLSSDV